MKSKLKDIYYQLLKLKSRVFNGRPVLVTMYHRTSDEVRHELKHLTVSSSNFDKQLTYFKKNYQILRLTDDWSSLKKTGLVITFDDGYADNLLNALPILEKYQIPATIFITTLNINSKKEFWWDRLVFDYSNCYSVFFLPNIVEKVSKKNYSFGELSALVNKLTNIEKEEWFLKFEDLNEITFNDNEHFRSLTNDELLMLSNHPLIDIGLHTHNHYSLGNLNYEQQKEELTYSIEKLNTLVTKSVNYIALPHGSYNKDTLRILEELNYSGMLLANNYYSSYKNKSAKKINRILMPDIVDKKLVKYMNRFDFKTVFK